MANWGKEIVKSVKVKGYVEVNGVLYPPNSPQAIRLSQSDISCPKRKKKRLKLIKTGWTDDSRNIKNKEGQKDPFIMLIKKEFGLEVWPEFFFSTERLYRLDYAIPVNQHGIELKIAIEVQGGIWAKGNSGHSSGTGIARDMEKANLLQSLGWRLIQVTPSQLMTNYTLELVNRMILSN